MKFIAILSVLLIAACASTPPKTETPIVIKKVEVAKPAPIVPSVDQLRLRDVTWIVITPENIDAKFKEIKTGDIVLFALTPDGYQNLALNMSDVRSNIEQYKQIIAIYKKQYQ